MRRNPGSAPHRPIQAMPGSSFSGLLILGLDLAVIEQHFALALNHLALLLQEPLDGADDTGRAFRAQCERCRRDAAIEKLAHGYAEHAGRYGYVAARLTAAKMLKSFPFHRAGAGRGSLVGPAVL